MRPSKIFKSISAIVLSASVFTGCANFNSPSVIGYNYTTDKPGHNEIVQIFDLNGHTVVQVRSQSIPPRFISKDGEAIEYQKFGANFQLKGIHRHFQIKIGSAVINVDRIFKQGKVSFVDLEEALELRTVFQTSNL